MRWTLAAFFVAAGVAHLAVPDELLQITSDWVPFAPQTHTGNTMTTLCGHY
jgi:hypothetical protein